MGEYFAKHLRPTTGGNGTPALFVRKDKPADLAGTDAYYVEGQVDSAGSLRCTEQGGLATFYGVGLAVVPVASATDIAQLFGSATKTVRVQEIRVQGVATAAVMINTRLIRRSTANSGGTAATPTLATADSGDTATAVMKTYTANPTTGAAVADVDARKLGVVKADLTGGNPPELVFDLRGKGGGKGLRLSGVAEGICLNLNGETVGAGGSFNIRIVWTEEPTTA